ncbi:DUF732 domain-containing protein [Mycobacterium sp.]|uniref:DUF732 domain-containing protein n=1 Tax=Mycobacterium sp. TaxID=1785 RepID=UPI0025EC7D1D|nr:DUF732 domain-containing protein [Mycobacterium sp.]
MLVALSIFVAIIVAPTRAGADPVNSESGPDATFLAALDQAGVPYKSGPVAIAVGKKACELMDQGHPEADVIRSLAASNPGYTTENATNFATSAVNAYCPQHVGQPTTTPAPLTLPPNGLWPIFPLPTPGAG